MGETLRFSSSLYRLDSVERAAAALARCAIWSVRVEGNDILVDVSEIHPKLADRLVDEFRNRCLYDTVLSERGGGSL